MFNHLMGAKLKEFRLQSGLSIASAAATVGVTSSFISMVENGKSGISLAEGARSSGALWKNPF